MYVLSRRRCASNPVPASVFSSDRVFNGNQIEREYVGQRNGALESSWTDAKKKSARPSKQSKQPKCRDTRA